MPCWMSDARHCFNFGCDGLRTFFMRGNLGFCSSESMGYRRVPQSSPRQQRRPIDPIVPDLATATDCPAVWVVFLFVVAGGEAGGMS